MLINTLRVPRVVMDQANNSVLKVGSEKKDLFTHSVISSSEASKTEVPFAVAGAVTGFVLGKLLGGVFGQSVGCALGLFAGVTASDLIGDRQAFAKLGGKQGSTISIEQMNSLRSIRTKENGFIGIPLVALFTAVISTAK